MMLEKLLRPTSIKILEILNSRGEKSLTIISKTIGLSKPGTSKHLKDLISIGVVKQREEKSSKGIETFYSINQFTLMLVFNPQEKTIINIISKSDFKLSQILLEQEQLEDNEFKNDLKLLLEKMETLNKKDIPIYIILFGSVARNEGTWKSDIDLAFIDYNWSQEKKQNIENLIAEVTLKTEHQIKPKFIHKLEFENNNTLIINEIKESGVIIFGDIFRREKIWKEMKRYKNITI